MAEPGSTHPRAKINSPSSSIHDAATVILLRPAPSHASGFDVYMVKRPSRSRFMPGAFVFPGGRVEESDASIEAAAVRETHEEANVTIREKDLVLWSRWITPDVEPRRYDARFFLAQVSFGTEATADPVETVGGMWTSASDMLLREKAGDAFLAPPTQRCLELLSQHQTAHAVLEEARGSQVPVIKPIVVRRDEELFVALPGDPEHPQSHACIPGATRIALPNAWRKLLDTRKNTHK